MYKALYRTYRPETFQEILGQEHIVKILRNQIDSDTVGHAYLFCGTRGTGKTTMARILAKAVNCTADEERPCGVCEHCQAIKDGVFIDVTEIDAASNNGVDNIRELRESVKYAPAVGRKKVYIVDEVHMLSTGAFNALLKTLEEPPDHVMFILATTEPQKLPATILSRCMRLDFKRVPENVLCAGMAAICKDRNIEIEEGALRLIAGNADGSVRDGLSILDQCLASGEALVTRDDVLELLGTAGQEVFIEMTDFVARGDAEGALILLNRMLADGKDTKQFTKDWLAHYRNLMITKFVKEAADFLNVSAENCEKLSRQSKEIDLSEINHCILTLAETASESRYSTQARILLDLAVVKMAQRLSLPADEPTQRAVTSADLRRETASASGQPPAAREDSLKAASAENHAIGGTNTQNTPPPHAQEDARESQTPRQTDTAKPQGAPQAPAAKNEVAPAVSEIDLSALWRKVFELGESTKSSFNIIRTGTCLVGMTEEEFRVSAGNSLKLKYVEDNRGELERLMERLTGKARRLKAFVDEPSENGAGQNLEELKASVESALGISVTIEG